VRVNRKKDGFALTEHTASLKEFAAARRRDCRTNDLAAIRSVERARPCRGGSGELTGFFCQPIPARLRQSVEAYAPLSPGVHFGFQKGADVQLTVEPKMDHSLSPENCLNRLRSDTREPASFWPLRPYCSWSDLSGAQRYQLGVYALPDRNVSCQAMLRLPKKGGDAVDYQFSSFDLRPEERACNPSGPVVLPEDFEVDRERDPQLLIFFDTQHDLELRLDYISIYFA